MHSKEILALWCLVTMLVQHHGRHKIQRTTVNSRNPTADGYARGSNQSSQRCARQCKRCLIWNNFPRQSPMFSCHYLVGNDKTEFAGYYTGCHVNQSPPGRWPLTSLKKLTMSVLERRGNDFKGPQAERTWLTEGKGWWENSTNVGAHPAYVTEWDQVLCYLQWQITREF